MHATIVSASKNPAASPPARKSGSSIAGAVSTSRAITPAVVDLEDEEITAATGLVTNAFLPGTEICLEWS